MKKNIKQSLNLLLQSIEKYFVYLFFIHHVCLKFEVFFVKSPADEKMLINSNEKTSIKTVFSIIQFTLRLAFGQRTANKPERKLQFMNMNFALYMR